jgi:hypothetical protein
MNLVCNRCKESKPEEDFYNNKKHSARNFKSYSCKNCDYIRNKELYEINRETYSKRNNDRNRKRKTGFTPELFEQLRKEQGNTCAICGIDKPGGNGDWQADHCHDTKTPRGLLCWHCNVVLGLMKDNPERLRSAAMYLEKYNA